MTRTDQIAAILSDKLDDDAVAAAVKVTGLRPDQIERAVAEYRKAADALHEEPEWRAFSHMCGTKEAYASYIAHGVDSQILKQISSWKVRDEWKQRITFTALGKPYETYGEARAAELLAISKFQPSAVTP